ncbi:TRAP-type C4-dicarboxylate transport system permease small subunit [Pseudorhizobium tarimense]|uniref:TRAP transporter small permease protein n=1 Tax=Pseudorhizobium tarimense TaxID=1079109 RepID=A0ABV2H6D9_9HYPH|nr:TRAP transporter small permease [Pseudorhizobium tarimense]MCJ8519087.1 TRAP transporter small permease [Pseudorhizobium tarimense]
MLNFSALIGCHRSLTKGMFALAMISLLLFTVMFNIEVALRYFFNAPTNWSQDVIGIATLVVIFLGLPYVTMSNAHVTIDILVSNSKPGTAKILHFVARITTVLVLLYAAYIVGGEALKQFTRGTMTASSLPIPKWPLLAVMVLGLLSSAIHVATGSKKDGAA